MLRNEGAQKTDIPLVYYNCLSGSSCQLWGVHLRGYTVYLISKISLIFIFTGRGETDARLSFAVLDGRQIT